MGILRTRSRLKNAMINMLMLRIKPKMMRSRRVMFLRKRKLQRYPGIMRRIMPPINFASSTNSTGISTLYPSSVFTFKITVPPSIDGLPGSTHII
jgi:hypothetical protein